MRAALLSQPLAQTTTQCLGPSVKRLCCGESLMLLLHTDTHTPTHTRTRPLSKAFLSRSCQCHEAELIHCTFFGICLSHFSPFLSFSPFIPRSALTNSLKPLSPLPLSVTDILPASRFPDFFFPSFFFFFPPAQPQLFCPSLPPPSYFPFFFSILT